MMYDKKLLKQAQFHGLNKLDDVKYRWVWITALLLLLVAATNVAWNLVFRFLEAPTYIVRKEKAHAYMEFPSVQLCPELNFPDHRIDEFFSQLKYPANINISYIKSVIQQLGAFYSPDVSYEIRDLIRIQSVLEYNKIDVYTATKMMTLPCEETMIKCRLFGQMKNCTELFKLEISQYGYCCIFNSRSLRSEILKYGIHKVKPEVEYFTPFVGFGAALIVAVNQSTQLRDVDRDYKWMSVDGGQAYIDATKNGTPLSPSMEMWFGYYKEGFHIDEYAVNLDPSLRGCRMHAEKLPLFPLHHKKYCQVECEARHLIRNCKCVLLPHPVPPNVSVCRARYLPCAKNALTKLNKGACPCHHTCDADNDQVEISSFRLYQNTTYIDPFYSDLDFSKTSVVRVFITRRGRRVMTKSRRAYYTYEDLFAQLGGIFNLFFGCSLLSILEILQIIKYSFKSWRERRKVQTKHRKTNKQDRNKTKNKKVTFRK